MSPCERCNGRRVVLVGWESVRGANGSGWQNPLLVTCPDCAGTGLAPHAVPPVRS